MDAKDLVRDIMGENLWSRGTWFVNFWDHNRWNGDPDTAHNTLQVHFMSKSGEIWIVEDGDIEWKFGLGDPDLVGKFRFRLRERLYE
jgi:hypothetical protein